jgi:hypothetical protein
MNRISPHTLQTLRNDLDVARVITRLGMPSKIRGPRIAVRCPDCGRYETTTSPDRNLVRRFRRARGFNPIHLVMAQRGDTFLQAVRYLEDVLYGP